MRIVKLDEMCEAIYDGDCAKIDALIAEGRDVNSRTKSNEWNFLHRALVSITFPPIPDVVRHLITIGVDVNAKDRCLWTPLLFAVRTRNSQVVKLLIEAGAEINTVNDKGITPLHQSLLKSSSSLEITEMLLAAGADPDHDRGGGTARKFLAAIARPDKKAILELFDKYRPAKK